MTSLKAINVQAHLHHQYFLGLQLMVAVEEGKQVVGEWMFRLFRQQHLDKFLSSFEKLGLTGLPHAVACAKYHTLSNGVGGVQVEYHEETDKKAWVRFRYPRWMYAGPAICGIPREASLGFLKGWYAHNGVSLQNPRLGYVCVSEDLTGEFGLCGYFKEYDYDLSHDERLQFAKDERPPKFDPSQQPRPPEAHWSEERLAKGARNYALEYCRNGVRELVTVIGRERALALARRAARLTGLQQSQHMTGLLGFRDDDHLEAGRFLATVLAGMGDATEIRESGDTVSVIETGLRIVRGMSAEERTDMLTCWVELWQGTIDAQRSFKDLSVEEIGNSLIWTIRMQEGA